MQPELPTAGKYEAPSPVRATRTGLSPLICLDHSDTVGAKSQEGGSLFDGVVTLEESRGHVRLGVGGQGGWRGKRPVKVKCEL